MYGVLSLRSHRVPSFGAFYRLLPAWLRRTAAAALTLGTIGALGAILTVMAEDPGVRVPVIMYHAVMDDASRLGKYVISPEELESDFKWLSENGYTAILSEDLITRMTCTARTVRGSAQSSFPGNLWKTTRSFSPKM